MAQFSGKLTTTLTRSAFVTVRRQTWFVFHISPCLKQNLQVTLEPVDAELLWDRTVRRVDLPQGTYAASLIASVWAAAGVLQTSVTQ